MWATGLAASGHLAHRRVHVLRDQRVVFVRYLVEVALEGEPPVLAATAGHLELRRVVLHVEVLVRGENAVGFGLDAEGIVLVGLLLRLEDRRVVLEDFRCDRRDTAELLFFITPRIYRPEYLNTNTGSASDRPRTTIVQPVPLGNPASNSDVSPVTVTNPLVPFGTQPGTAPRP